MTKACTHASFDPELRSIINSQLGTLLSIRKQSGLTAIAEPSRSEQPTTSGPLLRLCHTVTPNELMSTQTIVPAALSEITKRIQTHQAKVGIIGLGYVGLPLALLYCEQKFPVIGFDIDERKVSTLRQGGSYIYRIEAGEIQQAREQGFDATSDYSRIKEMDAIIICVPTPLNEYHEPDLSYITNTAASIAPHLRAGQIVILESTTYPGTTEEVMVPILEKGNRLGLKAARGDSSTGAEFYVAFSPEREDPGNTTVARRDIPKVVGGLNPSAAELAAALYGSIFNRVVRVSSPAAAEMTKLLENIYRCVNIALVNELKMLSLRMGLDIWEVIAAASTKPFGFHPQKNGIFAPDSSNSRARSTSTCPIS